MLRRGPASNTDINVHLPCHPTREASALMTQNLIQHFWFMRNQTPCLLTQLRKTVEEYESHGPKRRLTSRQRKLQKFVVGADNLMSCISPVLFTLNERTRMLFLFGPTPQRPHEVVEVILTLAGDSQVGHPNEVCPDTLTRKVLRTLVMEANSIPEGRASAGPTRFFVMLQAPRLENAPPGFLPRPALQLSLQKTIWIRITFSSSKRTETSSVADAVDHRAEAIPMGQVEAPSSEDGAPLVWYQSVHMVKGICAASCKDPGA
eukprot:jgi/Botrbrau1/15558/Bobra.0274s0002.1